MNTITQEKVEQQVNKPYTASISPEAWDYIMENYEERDCIGARWNRVQVQNGFRGLREIMVCTAMRIWKAEGEDAEYEVIQD